MKSMMSTLLQDALLLQRDAATDNGDSSYGCRYQTEEDAACQRELEAENSKEYGDRTNARISPCHNL